MAGARLSAHLASRARIARLSPSQHIRSRECSQTRLCYTEPRYDNREFAACNQFHSRPETPSLINT
jgi:hypothetical protein